MSTVKFTVPNWGQGLIAKAVNLDPDGIVVRMEDDSKICFLEHKTQKEYIVNKSTGNVVVA